MAVEPKNRLVREYWPRYKRRILPLVMVVHIVIIAIGGLMAVLIGIAQVDHPGFWITMAFVTIMSLTINYLLFKVITEPLEMLTNAISHIAGEQSGKAAPNTSNPRLEKQGFNILLQSLYGLAASKPFDGESADGQDGGIRKALNATPTGIVFLDKEGKIMFANKSAPVRQSSDGSLMLELIFDVDETLEHWRSNLGDNNIQAQKTWKRISNKIIGEEDRKIYDFVASYQQGSEVETVVTFFERTEDYLPEDNDLDFIAFAAHELRGPITVIRGYIDTLESEMSDRLRNDEAILFNRLTVSANRLSGYINNILNVAKYDRRHLKIHINEETVAGIYDTIRDDMELRAYAQNRLLQVNIPPDLPKVGADVAAVGEVIANLIDNAIKYSNEGGVVIVEAKPLGKFVEISVTDKGIGMPSNVMSNLFHKFYRSHRSRETVSGTGIGLYICKVIVESHGGEMGVRSIENEGSTFTFTLPTYGSIEHKLTGDNNTNEGLIQHKDGWIKNHGTIKR